MFKHVYRLLASLKLAVILLVVLASVLARATFLEADKGREYAQWHVYGSPWFVALLALLGLNILAAALIRYPWKKRQFGFVVTHAGLLVLLAGSIQTFLLGIDGQLVLREGEQAEEILMTDRSVITVVRDSAGARASTDFAFTPGPDDWPDKKHLDFGDLNGLGLDVLKFYRHAREQTDWVADDTDYQGPALRLQLTGPGGHTVAEQWLTATVFGGEVVIGPTKYQLLPIPCDSMAEDFREPPAVEPGSAGVLSIHHEGQMYRVNVDEELGQKVPLGKSGVAVEVVEYLANAQPAPDGRFVSRGDQAANPLLELKIHEPDRDQPTRQVAFARLPLLNLDAVHGRSSPVKFWYHHTGITHPPGAVFLQTPDGTLYCRPVTNGALGPAQEVSEGGTIQIGGQFAITVVGHLKRARKDVSFVPVELAAGQTNRPEAAALVEVTINGRSRQVWLKRHDQQFGMQRLMTSQGPMLLGFGYEQLPLGYRIELRDFVRRLNPGRMGNAAFASTVRLIDPVSDVDQQHEISMNEPLSHGKITFYQSSFQELPGGMEVSVLTAAYDPGRTLKYLGSLMICTGIFIMFYMRAYMFQDVPRLVNRGRGPEAVGPGEYREEAEDAASPDIVSGDSERMNPDDSHVYKSSVLLAAAPLLNASSYVHSQERQTFDWDQWRYLPVQDGGRDKPFDSLAWETFRTISNRTGLADPETGQRMDANTLYLVLLFDWQGWDRSPDPQRFLGKHSQASYFNLHQPDKWDHAPLLRVDFLALRSALALPEDQKYIAPLNLSRAKIRIPETNADKPFLRWAEGLIAKQQEGLTTFEKKALELANKFWSYQDHRMGNRMSVIPVQDSDDREWVSIASLMRAGFDDETDPTGRLRQAQVQFQQARAAYFGSSPADFNHASQSFIATVRELGPELGLYPKQAVIDLEVFYSRWAPFRFAWVCTLLAFLCLLLSMGTHWKPFYVTGWATFVAGLVAMIVGFAMRVTISGRAPVTNMYESVIYVGLGVAVFGLLFELIYRRQYILTAAAGVATVVLILADNCPAALDPSLRPLQPVLRSNFWLVIHVMTITLSYAAFALALGIGNVTLGYYLARCTDHKLINSLSIFTYKAIQVGVLLLAAGTILGGVWADYSWGRFWGWDPKEVWALVALLGYLAVLHARYAGWVRQFGLAALSVICFSLVVMAWYGVNFVLGAGLHSYGFGGGGQSYVLGAVALQFAFVGAAAFQAAYGGQLFRSGCLAPNEE